MLDLVVSTRKYKFGFRSIVGESDAVITQPKLKNKKTVFHDEDNSAEQSVVSEPTKIMQASKYRKPKKYSIFHDCKLVLMDWF